MLSTARSLLCVAGLRPGEWHSVRVRGSVGGGRAGTVGRSAVSFYLYLCCLCGLQRYTKASVCELSMRGAAQTAGGGWRSCSALMRS